MLEASRLSVDPVALSAHVLSAVCMSISDEWRVRPKLNDKWTKQARLWVCVIKGDALRGATDMINSAWAPVVNRQVDVISKWKADMAAWIERNPNYREKKFVPDHNDPRPPEPVRYYTNNGTVESLTNILSAENPTRKVGYFADELVSFLDFGQIREQGQQGRRRWLSRRSTKVI